MKRRGFLTGLFAIAVAPLCPKFKTDNRIMSEKQFIRLQKGIINAHLEEMALSIHKPMVRRKNWEGTNVKRVTPGKIINTEPYVYRYNILEEAFKEVEEADKRIQKVTGVCDYSSLG